MSDRMTPLSIKQLYKLIFKELENNETIFGIARHLFFDPSAYKELHFVRYGKLLESPLGVAAGPHTQLSQNIISAWLVGARYIELKTVQTLDELEVSKPCIDMGDEGYNCEWSQELKLEQSFREYLNAWIMIHVLREKLNLKNDGDDLGTIFNMSVGYNLEGIMNDNVQQFLAKMKDCSKYKKAALAELKEIDPDVDKIKIPDCISDNITLSTMHGCPPNEVEKIGMYLIEDLKVHTTIKLNPTLNGPEALRSIVNDKLGFKNVTIPDIAFEHDLKYADAVKIISNLKEKAKKVGVDFSIKLTNTLETVNAKGYFDKSNQMMYMSGRPLHALAINLACKLQKEFDGKLDISFSSGADSFNIREILALNIRPVTVCSDLLKPGGYTRLFQYLRKIRKQMREENYKSLEELVTHKHKDKSIEQIVQERLGQYLEEVLLDKRYHKSSYPWDGIKTDRSLSFFDCIKAPCETTCPTNQNVPEYVYLTMVGEYDKALEVVRRSNPFPNATGFSCDHICENKCSRINYDWPVRIRDIKRFLAMKEESVSPIEPKRNLDVKVGIIGGGPSGLSAAYFLALEGFRVEVFEAKSIVGGMLTHALPDFRVQRDRVLHDVERIKSLGVVIHENSPISSSQYEQLEHRFDYIYVAVGARLSKKMNIPNEDVHGVMPFLQFLEEVKLGNLKKVPSKVLVVGGGNSAIDAVRTAKRLLPKDGELKLVYRRTVDQMPASAEEIEELLEENIEILELTAPVEVITKNDRVGGLKCQKMKLDSPDDSGRRRPVPMENSFIEIPADLIIPAIGQDVDSTSIPPMLQLTGRGTIATNEYQSLGARILSGGDVVRGPSSIIKGVADGKEIARKIATREGLEFGSFEKVVKNLSLNDLRKNRANRKKFAPLPKSDPQKRKNFNLVVQTFTDEQANVEAHRCLMCDELCEVCVTVCPNRANVSYQATPVSYTLQDLFIKGKNTELGAEYIFALGQTNQVVNIGDFCNECANCVTFCPSSGKPFVDKPKVYYSFDSFEQEKHNAFFFTMTGDLPGIKAKIEGEEYYLQKVEKEGEYRLSSPWVDCTLNIETLAINNINCCKFDGVLSMERVATMAILLDNVQQLQEVF